jgi:F-type H+/Na+-transporting ATPase subunit beta
VAATSSKQGASGTVVSVRGSVVDVRFPDHLPGRFNLLRAVENQAVAVEVLTYLDSRTVRKTLTRTKSALFCSTKVPI